MATKDLLLSAISDRLAHPDLGFAWRVSASLPAGRRVTKVDWSTSSQPTAGQINFSYNPSTYVSTISATGYVPNAATQYTFGVTYEYEEVSGEITLSDMTAITFKKGSSGTPVKIKKVIFKKGSSGTPTTVWRTYYTPGPCLMLNYVHPINSTTPKTLKTHHTCIPNCSEPHRLNMKVYDLNSNAYTTLHYQDFPNVEDGQKIAISYADGDALSYFNNKRIVDEWYPSESPTNHIITQESNVYHNWLDADADRNLHSYNFLPYYGKASSLTSNCTFAASSQGSSLGIQFTVTNHNEETIKFDYYYMSTGTWSSSFEGNASDNYQNLTAAANSNTMTTRISKTNHNSCIGFIRNTGFQAAHDYGFLGMPGLFKALGYRSGATTDVPINVGAANINVTDYNLLGDTEHYVQFNLSPNQEILSGAHIFLVNLHVFTNTSGKNNQIYWDEIVTGAYTDAITQLNNHLDSGRIYLGEASGFKIVVEAILKDNNGGDSCFYRSISSQGSWDEQDPETTTTEQ